MILLFLFLCPRFRSVKISSSSSPAREQLSMIRSSWEDPNNYSSSNNSRTDNSNNLFLFPHHSSSSTTGYSNNRYLLFLHHLHRSQLKLNVAEAFLDGWFQSDLTVEPKTRIDNIILSLVLDHRLCSRKNSSSNNPARI